MFDPTPNAGKDSLYDAPIYIADAAVYLMATKPDLEDHQPVRARRHAVRRRRRPAQGAEAARSAQYWTDYLKQMDSLPSRDVDLGTTWQIITNLLQGEDPAVPVEVIKPHEGATGWSDTWMINSKTKNLDVRLRASSTTYVSPETNAKIAEWFGEAPGNSKSCALTADPNHCDTFHADDDAFWKDVWYWQTPDRRLRRRPHGRRSARASTTGSRPGPRSRADHGRTEPRTRPGVRTGVPGRPGGA